MNTNRWTLRTLGAATGTLALLAITLGTAAAQTPSTTAFFFSSHPMISGTVVSVNDHQMVVNTDQGEQVSLEVDSRTMAPRDFAPGMVMRVEFRALEDCRLYAERIMPVRSGMSADRLQAYANTREAGTVMPGARAAYGGDGGYRNWNQVTDHDAARREPPTGELYPGPVMSATHTTRDFQFSDRPLLTGNVISVTDHRMLVETDQGQRVGLSMDSNTLLPREVGPGSIVRAQFTVFKDGRYYAQRISRIGHATADREQAYAHTRDSEFALASTPPECGARITPATMSSVLEPVPVVAIPEPVAVQYVPAPVAAEPEPVEDREETLPQTSSNQPLILVLGFGAFGLAGLIAAARALRTV